MSRSSRNRNGLSRRYFLKGIGASIALPAFDSLGTSSLFAAAARPAMGTTSTGAPLRTAFLYFPNGAIQDAWWPTGKGRDFAFNNTLKPLEPLRNSLQVMGGLDHENATAGPDGAGDHARGNGVFLTGVRLNKHPTDIRAGKSIDQTIADQVGPLTRFPSLELSCDNTRRSGSCDSGYSCAYQYNFSWKSPTMPMTPEANPRKVFERLFGEGPQGERSANAQRRMQNRQSILDFVLADAKRMRRSMGHSDKEKLDQYLTGVRDIETRIEQAEAFGPTVDPEMDTPSGIPFSHGDHMELMFDLMILAFQTDTTRISTLLLAHDGDNRSHEDIGVSEGHHELTHHRGNQDRIDKVARIDRWYIERLAGFLKRLDETRDVDGNSLLYNSMIVYGSGNSDGNQHTHHNLPILLAGHGGGTLNTGRFVQHRSIPTTNLFLSMADRMGVENLPSFGDSTGRLANI